MVDYHTRAYWMAENVAHFAALSLTPFRPDPKIDVIIEVPNNWFTDKGMGSKDSEDIQKLYFQVGAIIGVLASVEWVQGVWCVTPNTWKGTTPKPVMVQRAQTFAQQQHVFLRQNTPHDTCEAILLARYAMKLQSVGGYQEPLTTIFQAGVLPGGVFDHSDFIDGDEDSPDVGGPPELPDRTNGYDN